MRRVQAQEALLQLQWPRELLEHPLCAPVTVGDVTGSPGFKGKGPLLYAGLRVRMGVNTGLPDDVFLHHMTEDVDYRGDEYDLCGEICDLGSGGQVLMGPKTFQRCVGWGMQAGRGGEVRLTCCVGGTKGPPRDGWGGAGRPGGGSQG